ncbi:MAG: RNA-binding transcriptional accessory protein [Clostridiales bacterium]|jgi:uncharacterized protein|nr:RNA-binding transcriptional accessory protein [Clostridiales bacterium]
MDILFTLQKEFKLNKEHLENTIKLIDDGNTIPFIARYRKELTGSMDDQLLRGLYDRLMYLRNLDEKRMSVKNLIAEQGNLTEEIEAALLNAYTLTEIDDIYRPFRPKRRTKATIAKEKGLEPLANIIWAQLITCNIEDIAEEFVDSGKNVDSVEDAILGAKDIIAEIISDDANIRGIIRKELMDNAMLQVKAVDKTQESVYEMYYDFQEPINKLAPHRVLAINRGEKENFLSAKIAGNDQGIINKIERAVNSHNKFTDSCISEIVEDSYHRLIFPSIEREVRNSLTEAAEEGAIKVFAENLRQLLLQPPIKDKHVLALDPGFRTGCKVGVVDQTGKVLYTGVVYCTPPQNKIEESKKILIPVINKFDIDIIAIGNGTASRETEAFVSEMLKEVGREVFYVMVNEAGASVYSASKIGAEEFPGYDVSQRSAISIARRLQDPLAELVKIDPKSIGVGQYQHDMNQKRLGESLGGVVEACVNSVGINLNTASPSLLSYVSGVSMAVAKNIIEYREENGKFSERKELLKVKKLGPKTFEQCAGFLRILGGQNILDNTAVHPESYSVAKKIIKKAGRALDNLKSTGPLKFTRDELKTMSEDLSVGIPTLIDIISELEKPGRDPRDNMPVPVLRKDVMNIEDLKEGMVLEGTVRNIVDFGVFVDIGVHHDGLVHVSQISDGYIKHPLDAVKVGDIISVRVMGVNLEKRRIALTMRSAQ